MTTPASSSNASTSTGPIPAAQIKRDNIVFGKIVYQTTDNGTKYGRSMAEYKDPVSGRTRPLIFSPGPVNSFGVMDNFDDKKELSGYSVGLVPQTGQMVLEQAMTEIREAALKFVLENKDECNCPEATSIDGVRSVLKNPFDHPNIKDSKKKDTTKPKRLYAKLGFMKPKGDRPGKVTTVFDDASSYDPTLRIMTKTIDPLTVRSSVELIPSIHVDSLYIGNKPSLQIKLPRAAIIRELGMVNVPQAAEDVGEYMSKLGLLASNSIASVASGEAASGLQAVQQL